MKTAPAPSDDLAPATPAHAALGFSEAAPRVGDTPSAPPPSVSPAAAGLEDHEAAAGVEGTSAAAALAETLHGQIEDVERRLADLRAEAEALPEKCKAAQREGDAPAWLRLQTRSEDVAAEIATVEAEHQVLSAMHAATRAAHTGNLVHDLFAERVATLTAAVGVIEALTAQLAEQLERQKLAELDVAGLMGTRGGFKEVRAAVAEAKAATLTGARRADDWELGSLGEGDRERLAELARQVWSTADAVVSRSENVRAFQRRPPLLGDNPRFMPEPYPGTLYALIRRMENQWAALHAALRDNGYDTTSFTGHWSLPSVDSATTREFAETLVAALDPEAEETETEPAGESLGDAA